MNEKRVWVFFYGTYMDPAVLAANGIQAETVPARLPGYELEIKQRVNLVANDRGVAYGSIANLLHAELDTLYRKIEQTVGLIYLPEAVIAQRLDGCWRPALCYIVPLLDDAAPDADYLNQMLSAANAIGLPEWYVAHIHSFAELS